MAPIKSTTELIRRLKSTLVKRRLILASAGLFTCVAAFALFWVGLTLVANFWVLPIWLKVSLLVVLTATVLYLFGRLVIPKLLRGSVESVAIALEEANPSLKGRLIAAVQFSRSSQPEGYSRELIEAAKLQALEQAGGVDFSQVISYHPLWKTGRQLAAAGLLAGLMLVAAPGFFGYAFEVYSNPTTRVAPPVAYELTAAPGTTEWVKYRDIHVGGILRGERFPETARFHFRLAGGSWQQTEFDLTELVAITTTGGDSLAFGQTFRRADRSFDYWVEAGERQTDIQRIDIVDRPRVTGIHLSIFYPDYTGLSPLTIDENNGSFSAVVGSRATMKLELNLPVERAELVFEDSSRTPLAINGRIAETSLRIDRSVAYHVELVDHLGEQNPDPIEYYITAIPDEYPSIEVVRPGFDVNLNDEMILPLLVRIFDDYGFTSLVMKYTLVSQGRSSGENVAVLHFSDKIKTEGEVEFNWDMDALRMFPGDYVAYHFEIADNDQVSGPKVTSSRQYIARLPSLEEIIAQTERDSRQRITDIEELTRTGQELARRLKDAARKLEAQSPTGQRADWQQQKELESIVQKNEEMVEQISKAAEEMDRSLEQMRDNSLMSREIMEKLQQIQKLFEEVATPEMQEAQRKLMEALQQMDPETMRQAMEDFEMSQEELLQRLERTLALLKQMQAKAKMEAMIRKVEDLIEKQDKVNADTDAAESESMPDLSRAEKDNQAAMESLKKEAGDLRELLKEAQLDQVPEAQQFADAVEQSDADQNMEKMAEALEQSQKSEASSQGSQASSKLTQMLDQMRQAQMAMNQDDTEEIKKRLRRAIDHASNMSMDQEEQLRQARRLDPTSMVILEQATDQLDLAQACGGLYRAVTELGEISPFIAAELRSLVNDAIQNMNLATAGLEAKRGIEAIGYQKEAMSRLNRATTRLMESLNELNNCDNGSNCDKGMAKMESMCKKQGQLNQASQGMCKNPGQGSKPAQGAGAAGRMQELRRLASEQGAIRKSMQQLEQEFGGSRQILGRLSDIAREMEAVEEAMLSGEVGPETLERQLKIHSRMLEAARSLQRKDFTERRRAATATGQPVLVPPSLPASLLDDRVKLEDRLRRFMSDSYPPQYEEQIKAYFRALLKAEAERIQTQSGGSN